MGLSIKTKIPFDYFNKIEIGDMVCKRSRKPFQNGKRVVQVVGYTLVSIPKKKFLVGSLLLKDCDKPVTVRSVHYDQNELLMLSARDQRDELLECLVDEVMDSGCPSERTLEVLEKHKGYKIVDKYFKWVEENERF